MRIKKTATAGLFIAFTYLMTLLSVPNGITGYSNLGDAAVLLSSIALGPAVGCFTSAVGSTLADVTLGYFLYSPATALIKGSMPFIYYVLHGALAAVLRRKKRLCRFVSALLTELFMAGAYYIFNAVFVVKSFSGALISLGSDGVQGTVCLICFLVLSEAVEGLGIFDKRSK